MIEKAKNSELNPYNVFQNVAIGALACHSFTQGYYKVASTKKSKSNYPKLEYLFFVLPIVYHKDTMKTFKSSRELYNAILKNKSIVLGLHERANKMSSQTLDSLNLAFSKNLLSINKDNEIILNEEFINKKISIPANKDRENIIKNIQDSATKIGNIFAKTDEKNIQIELNIRF